jgi:hypothetical protein
MKRIADVPTNTQLVGPRWRDAHGAHVTKIVRLADGWQSTMWRDGELIQVMEYRTTPDRDMLASLWELRAHLCLYMTPDARALQNA